MLKLIPFIFLTLLTSCLLKDESPLGSSSDDVNLIQSGDIIVTNAGNDTIILLHEDGTYKSTLVDSQSDAALIFNGLAYDAVNKQVLFTNDHTTTFYDAVKTIDLYDGSVSTLISNSNLAGTLPGVARLTTGELVVLENTNTLEKFLANGTRSGAPFLATITTNAADISKLSNGGFVTCSSGTANTVRTYNGAGTVQATATSASPTPTLGALAATSCAQDPSGQIVVAYSGATDAVRVYDSTMSSVVWTFTDTNILTTPGKIAIRSNGNILVTDTGFNHIVEIDSAGALVRVIGGAVLSNPNNMIVIP